VDLEQLATFDRIVREGSFSRAAWALGVAQPTVSARIQALERTVGGPLFRRGGRGVALTDLGLSFLPYARRAIEVLEAGVTAARSRLAGAKTPWNPVRGMRGGVTRAARRARTSQGSNSTCVVPSRYGVFHV